MANITLKIVKSNNIFVFDLQSNMENYSVLLCAGGECKLIALSFTISTISDFFILEMHP